MSRSIAEADESSFQCESCEHVNPTVKNRDDQMLCEYCVTPHAPIDNLAHAVTACNELSWKAGEPEPYLLEAAREVLADSKTKAAPELLETLKRISYGLTLPSNDVERAIRKVCDEAIAKAEGRAS